MHSGIQGPTAKQGIKAHQQYQKANADEFASECSFKTTLEVDGQSITLGGRLDLLKAEAVPRIIHEIKSTLVPVSRIPDFVQEQHWAQLQVYGYCYLLNGLGDDSQTTLQVTDGDSIELGLVWLNLLDDQAEVDTRTYGFSQLEAFVLPAVKRYLDWTTRVNRWTERTRESAQTLKFPFGEFRPGQRDMAAASYRTFRDAGYLLCEAPTGIGKTVSALFPAMKAIGDSYVSQVVYLTAKTSGRAIALDAVKKMKSQGLETTSLVLQSKVRICHCSNGTCVREPDGRCPLTIGFFDRLPAARDELLDIATIDGEVLDDVATRHQVCPFELSLQILPWVTVVICDYNYVFDPLVKLTHFSGTGKQTALLLDESHNLVDRSRGMYSARLTRRQNREVQQACKTTHPAVSRAMANLGRAMDRWVKELDGDEVATTERPTGIVKAVGRCVEALTDEHASPLPDVTAEWFKELFRYLVIDELFSDHHRTVTRVTTDRRRKDVEIQLMCVNASSWLQKSFTDYRSVVAFSATLRPQSYYHTALGLPEETRGMQLPSPFSADQLGLFICPFIDTRYRSREASLLQLVNLISSFCSQRRGNYLVFFPSYAYLEQVNRAFRQRYPDIETIEQLRDFSLEEREAFMDRFSPENTLVGFAIMGGVFGEGVDYVGDRLIGSIIVGTGLSALSLEQSLISEDYSAAGLDGFDFAYRYPGFTRVLQTAGRVIRDEDDRGVVALVDQRFSDPFYRDLFPEHWHQQWCTTAEKLVQQLESFWAETQ